MADYGYIHADYSHKWKDGQWWTAKIGSKSYWEAPDDILLEQALIIQKNALKNGRVLEPEFEWIVERKTTRMTFREVGT